MILNQSQAKAVYDAMCYLNNVNGRIRVEIDDSESFITVTEGVHGAISVLAKDKLKNVEGELYDSQAEFAEAYEVA